VRVGIVTVSDRAAQGIYQDESGPIIDRFVRERLGWEIAEAQTVPDNLDQISVLLRTWADQVGLNLILTTGGTGFAPRDITPEATRAVIDREAPGLAEAMRAASLSLTPHAMLSRAVCGIRAGTLIINLPGSPKAVRENLEVLLPVLPHALGLLTETPGTETAHRPLKRA
jgi:molybdenum cofactor synthesis domain-containing protein